MGTRRHEFEGRFGASVGAAGARAFGRGREGLFVLLKALGVGEGDRVGVCAFTCLSVVEPVLLAGATPVYLDVDEYACIDPAALGEQGVGDEDKKGDRHDFSEDGKIEPVPRLKAVILQHTFGVPGRLPELLEAAKAAGAAVVEDCAHALGCSWDATPLGRFGEAALYSFGWGKPLATGRGGMVTVNSKALLDRLDAETERCALPAEAGAELRVGVERRAQGLFARAGCGLAVKTLYLELFRRGVVGETYELRGSAHLRRGYVRLMGEPTARAGLKALGGWPALKALRRENTELTRRRLAGVSLPPWPVPCAADVTMLAYPVLVADKPRVLAEARRRGLDLDGWYESPVAPLNGNALLAAGYEPGSCPWGEEISRHVVHVPTDSPCIERTLDALIPLVSRPRQRER